MLLLRCDCYDLCSKCTVIPGLNGKEGAGASVYYITGDTVRWRVVLCDRRTVGCARGGYRVIRD